LKCGLWRKVEEMGTAHS